MPTEVRANHSRKRRTVLVACALLLAALLVAAALSAGARGDGRDARAVRAAIQRHVEALATGDGKAFCATLTSQLKLTVLALTGQPCEVAIEEARTDVDPQYADPISIERLRVRGDAATALVRYDGPLGTAPFTLRRSQGSWLVDLEPEGSV